MKLLDKFQRQNENTRNVINNIIYSFGVKGLSIFIALFTTPSYMRYFKNNEVLGIWFTVLSVLAWMLNCDMGIGNGLRNKLVEPLVEKDYEKVKKYISSSYLFLIAVSLLVTLVLVIVSQFVSWNRVFNISPDLLSSNVLNKAIFILLLGIVLQFILNLIISILYALQKSFVPSLLNFITNAFMLTFVLICNKAGHNNDIIQLAVAYLIAVNLPLFITTIIVFKKSLKNAIPSLKYCQFEYAKLALKIGGVFLWLQLMAMILNNTNSYLITLFIGNSAVVEYQIYYKIFSLIGTIVLLMTAPIWSVVTKAHVEKDYIWMKKLYQKIAVIGGLAVLGEFVLIIFLQFIFNIWLQEKTIPVNYGYAFIYAISGSLLIWSSVITCFANGLSELKVQTIFLSAGALLNIPMTYLIVQMTKSSIAIIIANIISILPYCVVQTIWLNNYLKKKVDIQMTRDKFGYVNEL